MTENMSDPQVLPKIDFNKILTKRNAVRFVVGSSVKFVVTSAIVSLVPAETRVEKAKLFIGSYVISSLVVEKAKEYAGNEYDDVVEFVNQVNEFRKAAAQKSVEAETDTPAV